MTEGGANKTSSYACVSPSSKADCALSRQGGRRRDLLLGVEMDRFVQAIRSQEAYMKKPKPRKEQLPTDRRPPMKDSQIVQALHLMKMGLSPSHIAKELDVPVQTVYNVRQRYQLIKLEDGKNWYRYLGV